jgi:hypothetical protein
MDHLFKISHLELAVTVWPAVNLSTTRVAPAVRLFGSRLFELRATSIVHSFPADDFHAHLDDHRHHVVAVDMQMIATIL